MTTMSGSNAEANDIPATGGIGPVQWFGLSLLALSALALAAAHAGGLGRILLRFAPLFGLAGGAAVGWIASYAFISRRRSWIAAAMVLVACAYLGMTLEAYRMYVDELREQYTGGFPFVAAEIAAPLQQERQKILADRSRFAAYLAFRVSSHRFFADNAWPQPWPALFWGLEIVLAALVAGWAFSRLTVRPARNNEVPRSETVREEFPQGESPPTGRDSPADMVDTTERPERLHDDAGDD